MNKRLIAAIVVIALGLVGAIGYVTVSRLHGDLSVPGSVNASTAQTASRHPQQGTVDLARRSLPKLRAAAAKAPRDAAAWTQLGDAALTAGEATQAADAYRHALAITPGNATIWSSLGEVYVGSIPADGPHMPAQAKAAFMKALAVDPNDLRARFYLAGEKDAMGLHDEAMTDWIGILAALPRGSAPDRAVRTAISLSVQHQAASLKKRLVAAIDAQPTR